MSPPPPPPGGYSGAKKRGLNMVKEFMKPLDECLILSLQKFKQKDARIRGYL